MIAAEGCRLLKRTGYRSYSCSFKDKTIHQFIAEYLSETMRILQVEAEQIDVVEGEVTIHGFAVEGTLPDFDSDDEDNPCRLGD